MRIQRARLRRSAERKSEDKDTEMNNDNKNGLTKTAVSAPTREELQNPGAVERQRRLN